LITELQQEAISTHKSSVLVRNVQLKSKPNSEEFIVFTKEITKKSKYKKNTFSSTRQSHASCFIIDFIIVNELIEKPSFRKNKDNND